tara:strand:+ start:551 stop:1060 length:510 start_codon:yes stop_codon:yes gene_type:complete
MKSQFIIIAILIFVKVIGIGSRANATNYLPGYTCDTSTTFQINCGEEFYKTYSDQQKVFFEKWVYETNKKYQEDLIEKKFLEETKIINNIDNNSFTVEYLNGIKKYCIENSIETLACVDYSLISSVITNNPDKISFSIYSCKPEIEIQLINSYNNPVYRCGNSLEYERI